MKTVSEWLATSSDEDDEAGNSRLNVNSGTVSKKETPSSPSQYYKSSPIIQSASLNSASLAFAAPFSKTDNSSAQANVAEAQGEVAHEPPQGYRAVEVMVVDRGTQTMTTVGTQTDPLLPNENYWPPNEYLANLYGAPLHPLGVPFAYSSGIQGAGLTGNPTPLGNNQRPYHQFVSEVNIDQSHKYAELKHQLELIQNTVDTLISRYNLPPPPFSSLL